MTAPHPIYGETFLHEVPDGQLMEFRRDHAYNPDLYIECRYVRPDGEPFEVDGGKWGRVTGDGWDWMEATCPDLLRELREECL